MSVVGLRSSRPTLSWQKSACPGGLPSGERPRRCGPHPMPHIAFRTTPSGDTHRWATELFQYDNEAP